MGKTKILECLRQTTFFKSLTAVSQEKLISVWTELDKTQTMKILVLAGYERFLTHCIAQQVKPILSMAKKTAKKHLLTTLERLTRGSEGKNLDHVLNELE